MTEKRASSFRKKYDGVLNKEMKLVIGAILGLILLSAVAGNYNFVPDQDICDSGTTVVEQGAVGFFVIGALMIALVAWGKKTYAMAVSALLVFVFPYTMVGVYQVFSSCQLW